MENKNMNRLKFNMFAFPGTYATEFDFDEVYSTYYDDPDNCMTDFDLDLKKYLKEIGEQFSFKYEEELGTFLKGTANKDIDGIIFSESDSPLFYNYGNDRVFATISLRDFEIIYDYVIRYLKTKLSDFIIENYTSYSGFYSHYSNNVEDWVKADVQEFDNNEVATIIHILLTESSMASLENFEEDVLDYLRGNTSPFDFEL